MESFLGEPEGREALGERTFCRMEMRCRSMKAGEMDLLRRSALGEERRAGISDCRTGLRSLSIFRDKRLRGTPFRSIAMLISSSQSLQWVSLLRIYLAFICRIANYSFSLFIPFPLVQHSINGYREATQTPFSPQTRPQQGSPSLGAANHLSLSPLAKASVS